LINGLMKDMVLSIDIWLRTLQGWHLHQFWAAWSVVPTDGMPISLNPHRPHYHKFVIDRIPPIFDETKAQQNNQFLRTNFIRILMDNARCAWHCISVSQKLWFCTFGTVACREVKVNVGLQSWPWNKELLIGQFLVRVPLIACTNCKLPSRNWGWSVIQNLSYTLKTDDPPHAHPHHLVVKSRCPFSSTYQKPVRHMNLRKTFLIT
jgi:hypothetical protein